MVKLRLVSLQSGSKGNCYCVESGKTRILFDAGVNPLQTKRRLEQIGVDYATIQGIIISHAHTDHIQYAEKLRSAIGCSVWMCEQTARELSWREKIDKVTEPIYFHPGDTLAFNKLKVETLETQHDAQGVCFVVDNGSVRIGIMTDLGHRFDSLERVIPTLDAVLLESNYDPELLATGRYPAELKRRIRGKKGHISNEDAFQLLQKGLNLRWACLAHISEHNNNLGRISQLYHCIADVSACKGNCFSCGNERCIRQNKEHFLKILSGANVPVFFASYTSVTELPEL